jgi:YVTN family beta-propeller protein
MDMMMIRRILCSLLSALCLLLLLGCQPALLKGRPPLENEGEVYLYLDPYPQEAERLRFSLENISVMSMDGMEFPLTLSLTELKPSVLRRQRLIASGQLPSGQYAGFSFKVKKATLKVEDGEADLLLPETPVRIDFPINIERKKAYAFLLSFRYKESITGGFSFSPSFSFSLPTRPLMRFIGYVTNQNSNNITVFDKKTFRVIGVIATGGKPSGMALDQNGGKAYVAISDEDTIDLIDITLGEVVDRIKLHIGDYPHELALTADGRILLVANKGSSTVSFINTSSLLEVGRVEVGREPNSILIDRNGRRAFVFNQLSSTISVIDIANRGIVTTLSTDPTPLRGQFNRRGDQLYVIHELSSYLTVLDPLSLSILRRVSVRMGMRSIKVDTRTDLVYLGKGFDIMVEVYDPFSFVPVDSIRTGGGIVYMTIDGEENNLYMVNPETKSVLISNLVRKGIVAEIDVGEGPYWVTMMGER